MHVVRLIERLRDIDAWSSLEASGKKLFASSPTGSQVMNICTPGEVRLGRSSKGCALPNSRSGGFDRIRWRKRFRRKEFSEVILGGYSASKYSPLNNPPNRQLLVL